MATVPQPEKAGAVQILVQVVLVLVLAWQLAYWTWRFAAPAPLASPPDRAVAPVDLPAIARLFGAAAPASSAADSAPGLRLKGVVAPTPGVAASAIFASPGGKDAAVFVGGGVAPGVKLDEVHPDHVIVARAGVRSRIDLEQRHGSAPSAARGEARAPGFRINVAHASANQYSFARRELDEALRDPNQLGYLGQIGMPAGGGVRMEAAPAGSLAAKLGLQPGDIIRKVNGQPVASPGDLARLYQQFATLSQVQAEIQRGGTTLHLSYQIQ